VVHDTRIDTARISGIPASRSLARRGSINAKSKCAVEIIGRLHVPLEVLARCGGGETRGSWRRSNSERERERERERITPPRGDGRRAVV